MANPNLLSPDVRKKVLEEIKSSENVLRKRKSLADDEIYNDRAFPFVYEALKAQLGENTCKQMPIVSTMNVAKMVVEEEAKVYQSDPVRTVETKNDDDKKAVAALYNDMQFNSKLQEANIWYKYQKQAFVQVVLKDKTISLRVLQGHHVDVIPDANDSEKAYAYIISGFDKSPYVSSGDNVNQTIADSDDHKAASQRFIVWTAEYNFIMDGNGDIVSEIIKNAIQELPFVDISKQKRFEFFVRLGDALTSFTINFNVGWSDAKYISRMQGFSIGVLKGDPNLMPESLTIGPASLIRLPKNADNPNSDLSLEFVNPNPNVEASLKLIHDELATFLVTRGLDPAKVNVSNAGAKSYSSAIERLLGMISEFEASKEDFDLFRMIETQLFSIIKKYLVTYTGTDHLDKKYSVTANFRDATMTTVFHKPEMIETTSEKLDNQMKRLELGVTDRVEILAKLDNIPLEEAEKRIAELDARKAKAIQPTEQTPHVGQG